MGESREDALKLCIFFSLLQCVVLSPSQSLNLKALTRTLDETEVSSFQGVVGGETLDILHRNARRSAATAWDPSPAPHGIRPPRPCGFRLRRPHGTLLRRPRGALDMLHRNEEHALKSLHVD